jgi:hypothetical protein
MIPAFKESMESIVKLSDRQSVDQAGSLVEVASADLQS